jgi:hypothetical protein
MEEKSKRQPQLGHLVFPFDISKHISLVFRMGPIPSYRHILCRFLIFVHCPPEVDHSNILVLIHGQ